MGRRLLSAPVVVSGICAVLLGGALIAPGPARSDEGASGQPFEVVRGRGVLARIDTRTGEVWTTASNGDGGWTALGSAPAADDQPGFVGRYQVRPLATGGGRRVGSSDAPVRLLLTDALTGRAWMAAVVPEGRWLEIPEPDGAAAQSSAQ